jgi:outer membrane protein assembly factor BamE (lipoprotein component of BamABCDE complex)
LRWLGVDRHCRPVRERPRRRKIENTVPRLGSIAIRDYGKPIRLALALAGGLALAGCGSFTETLQRGYVVQEGALEQIPIGATQEQVLIVLGTPSTVATVSGEAFYYISQTSQRSAAFMPYEVKDQRVVAVYFDKNRRVQRLANYGLKDGKVFDFVSQTTPTGGKEFAYLSGVLRSLTPKI